MQDKNKGRLNKIPFTIFSLITFYLFVDEMVRILFLKSKIIIGLYDVLLLLLCGVLYRAITRKGEDTYKLIWQLVIILGYAFAVRVFQFISGKHSFLVVETIGILLLWYYHYNEYMGKVDARKQLSIGKEEKLLRRLGVALTLGIVLAGAYFVTNVFLRDIWQAVLQKSCFTTEVTRDIAVLFLLKLCIYFCYKKQIRFWYPISTVIACVSFILQKIFSLQPIGKNVVFILFLCVGVIEYGISFYLNLKRLRQLEENGQQEKKTIGCEQLVVFLKEKGGSIVATIGMCILSAVLIWNFKYDLACFIFQKQTPLIDVKYMVDVFLFVLWFGMYFLWVWYQRRCDLIKKKEGKIVLYLVVIGFYILTGMVGLIPNKIGATMKEQAFISVPFLCATILLWEICFYLCATRRVFLIFPISAYCAFFTFPITNYEGYLGTVSYSDIFEMIMGIGLFFVFGIGECILSILINLKMDKALK